MQPPRLILADAGNVRVVYKHGHRAQEVGRIFGRHASEVHPVLHRSEPFHALERGTVTWEAYVDYVEQMLCRGQRPPAEWSRERFVRIWVEALTDPILPVIEILEALSRHVPVVSASNVDVASYASVFRRHPRAKDMLAVHSDSMTIGRRKGDPDYFETLLAYVNAQLKTDVRPEECVFIDDVVEYVIAAKGQGMRTVWFSGVDQDTIVHQLKIDLLTYGVPDAWLP